MLSETEELLRSIPQTDHARFCKYPCYCMIGPGSEAQQAYLENIRRICTTGGQGQFYPLPKGVALPTIAGVTLPKGCIGVTIYGNVTIKPTVHRRDRGFLSAKR